MESEQNAWPALHGLQVLSAVKANTTSERFGPFEHRGPMISERVAAVRQNRQRGTPALDPSLSVCSCPRVGQRDPTRLDRARRNASGPKQPIGNSSWAARDLCAKEKDRRLAA
jgi:hypothetical protein